MMRALEVMEENIGMPLGSILLILVLLSCLIFYARDYKIGFIIQFVLLGCLVMISYANGWNYFYPFIAMLVTVVMMSLSIYVHGRSTEGLIP